MKSVCEKYPEWLAMQSEALSTQDYERYGAQYQVPSILLVCLLTCASLFLGRLFSFQAYYSNFAI